MASRAAQDYFNEIEEERQARLLSDDVIQEQVNRAKERVDDVVKRGQIYDDGAERKVLKFSKDELIEDYQLGEGGFCTVNAIGAFNIPTGNALPTFHSREFMASQCIREEGGARYAIKKLSRETRSDKARFRQGLADLVIEARLLAVIQHEHIVKLRGISDSGYMNKDFFIILDRLRITLDKQLIRWRESSTNSCLCFSNRNKEKVEDIYDDKISTAIGIAAALEYLHSKNIIYRDLKPDNIGFDVRENVKLFDFGLSTELDPSKANDEGTFKLTGFTGSPLYMAPEVAQNLPYNFKADVHSFGILLWQIMTTKMPFDKLTFNALKLFVMNGDHRPKIDPGWSATLSSLMTRCWNKDMTERPSFEVIRLNLLNEVFSEPSNHSSNALDISTKSFNGIMNRLKE